MHTAIHYITRKAMLYNKLYITQISKKINRNLLVELNITTKVKAAERSISMAAARDK